MKTNKPIPLHVLRPRASARRLPWWLVIVFVIALIAVAAQLTRA